MNLSSDHVFIRIISLAIFLFFWQLFAYAIDDAIFPGPILVFSSLWKHLVEDELLQHLSITLIRVFISFIIAMLIGTAIGILMGTFRHFDAGLDGLLILGLNIPALVTIILCYIWFGLTELAAVTAVAINKIPTVVVTVREGARAIDRKLLQVGDAFNVHYGIKFFKIYLPQLYPYLMAAARSGLALIWKIVLVVELLGRSDGVGFMLGSFFQFFDITSILAYTFAFAFVVLTIESFLMQPIDKRINRWRA